MRKNTIWYIILLALVLRILSLNQSFWLDEATSVLVARNYTIGAIIKEFSLGDFHPPLYYVLLKLWANVFGFGEIGLRSLSVVASLASIYLIYLIGIKIKDRSLGITASLLLATSSLFIYYSQEARMYSLSTLFVVFSVYFYLKILKDKPRTLNKAIFSLSLVLIFLTDYLSILIIAAYIVFPFLDNLKLKNKRLKAVGIALMPLVVTFIFWWPIFSEQLQSGIGVRTSASNWWKILGKTSFKNILLIPVKFSLGRISFENKTVYTLISASVLLFFGYFLTKAKYSKYKVIWLWLILPVLIGVVLGLFVPVLSYFRFLFVLPAFYILLAIGLINTADKYFLPIFMTFLFINFLTSGVYLSETKFQREDWRGFSNFVKEESKDKNYKIIFVADSQMEGVEYYWPEARISGPSGLNENLEQIWLMRYVQDVFDPTDSTRAKIEEKGYIKENEYDFNGIRVIKYKK
jgi:uncharacterized membrane protein